MIFYQLITPDCCKINKRILIEKSWLGDGTTQTFPCDGTRLYAIPEDCKNLLSKDEQAALIPYTPPEPESA